MPTKTPDITPAQIIAAIGSVCAQLVAFGLLGSARSQLIVGLAGIVVPFGVILADAIIRHGRSRALTPTASATVRVTPTALPPTSA